MIYDADYYECGIETGKSNYQNYRWIPELTLPLAMTIIDFLKIYPHETILDYGCAKGFLVKAFRMLHRQAWGYDISPYAISCADEKVRPYLLTTERDILSSSWDFGICKDVLEHIEVSKLEKILLTLPVKTLFTVVPLGTNGKYFAPANNLDVTHIICEDDEWWMHLFNRCGWNCIYSSTRVEGIKDSYKDFPKAHLFMVHENEHTAN